MTTTNAEWMDGHAELQTTGRACEAHDLKRILTTIADQIADADKRHSEALTALQQRLSGLGIEAKAVRAQATREMAPALDSIEHQMAELADKISEADDARRPAQAHVAALVPAHGPTYSTEISALAEPPAALRSALTADQLGSFTRREESARAAAMPAVDRFDVVSFDGSVSDDEPWDFASAEALTKLYETGHANLALDGAAASHAVEQPQHVAAAQHAATLEAPHAGMATDRAPEMPPVHDMRGAHDEQAAQPAHSASHAGDAEASRSIESQFVDLAAKLEQALAAMRPDASMSELGTRFDRLAERIGEAIGETAQRVDLSSLKSIESQVEDLTARLDSVQTHFSRLDTIELELRALADHINEDNLTRLFQRAQPRNPEADAAASRVAEQVPRIETALHEIAERLSEDRIAAFAANNQVPPTDANAMAMMVANKLAEQMSRHESGGKSIERIDDLRALLNGFIDEQRHGDEQTTTMLDTMQQALIRLLDRMDALETGGPAQGAVAHKPVAPLHQPLSPSIAAAMMEAPSPQLHAEDQMHAALAQRHPPLHEPDKDLAAAWSQAEGQLSKRADAASGMPLGDAPAAELSWKTGLSLQSEPAAAMPVENEAQVGGAESTPLNRDDFIAAARRAARQAAQVRAEAEEAAEPVLSGPVLAGPGPSLTAGPVGKPAAKPMPKPRPAPELEAKDKQPVVKRAGRQPSLMTIGMVCVITVGATFMLAKPYIASATRQVLDPAQVTPANGAGQPPAKQIAPGVNDGDEEIIEKPANPKRSSFPAPMNMGDAQTAEGAFVPAALPSDTGAGQAEGGLIGRIEEGLIGASNEMPPASIGPNSLRVAAAKGDPSAEFEVGARFAEGKGVQQDLKQAVTWYQRSASKGFAAAQYRLASMFERGLGVKMDLAKASAWYQRAAEQGNVKAMHNLAVLQAGRDGIAPNFPVAIRWFTLAAEHGLTDSQFNLAIMLETGLGLDKDARQAYKWFSLAARAGDAEASRRRDSVRASLLPVDQRAVDAEIEIWRPRSADVAINDTRVAGEAWKLRPR